MFLEKRSLGELGEVTGRKVASKCQRHSSVPPDDHGRVQTFSLQNQTSLLCHISSTQKRNSPERSSDLAKHEPELNPKGQNRLHIFLLTSGVRPARS